MKMTNQMNQTPGLYDPSFEHDNCGIAACVNIKGIKNRQTVDNALKIVETLEHRAGKDAAGETGDGVGIMLQISHKFFAAACKEAGIQIGNEREYGIGMFFFPNDELRLQQAKKDVRDHCGKRRNDIPWMERSANRSGCPWKESTGMYAADS